MNRSLLFLSCLLAAAASAASYPPGTKVEVAWGGCWWKASVLETRGDEVLIKYTYSSDSPSWMRNDDKIRFDKDAPQASAPAVLTVLPAVADTVAAAESGAYDFAARVEVSDGGSWWKARVVKVEGERALVKYTFGGPVPEWVDRSRIRPDAEFAPLAAQGLKFYYGVWGLQGHVVFNATKEKRIDNARVRQFIQRGGGHVGGFIEIRPNGTYDIQLPAGKLTKGKWGPNTVNERGGIVLAKPDPIWGDLLILPEKGGTLLIQSATAGGAGYRGFRIP